MTPRATAWTLPLLIAALLGLGLQIALQFSLKEDLHDARQRLEATEQQLQALTAEMTRYRIEQSTGSKGIAALLEQLKAYAPELTSGMVPKPEYRQAKKEMDAVLQAVKALGKDAFEPIHRRFLDLGQQEFDERKWLLEAMVAADRGRGLDFAQQVLEGYHQGVPVTSRMRLYAADVMVREDQARAGLVLRNVLRTESVRGINPERASPGITIPDPSVTSSGFENFIDRYMRSEDPERAATLQMILGRGEHDLRTLQESIKCLAQLQCHEAVPAIQKLYARPPVVSENPIFMMICLDAIADIDGEAARPYLEEQLKDAGNELVANKIKHRLQDLDAQKRN